jgi:hypothetical protein
LDGNKVTKSFTDNFVCCIPLLTAQLTLETSGDIEITTRDHNPCLQFVALADESASNTNALSGNWPLELMRAIWAGRGWLYLVPAYLWEN